MKKIQLTSDIIEENVHTIARVQGGKIDEDCDETCLVFSQPFGEGEVRGVNFQNGLGLLNIHCKLAEKVQLEYVHKDSHPIRLIFCVQGSITHTPVQEAETYTLDTLRGSISVNPTQQPQTITLPADTPITVNILEIKREEYLEKVDCVLDKMPRQLANIFRFTPEDPVFLYIGNYSLQIAECIQQINRNNLKGLARDTYLESKALELFSLMVQQYEDDLKVEGKQKVFRQADVSLIENARDILRNNLKNPPTISQLAQEVGINEQKLKKGFKLLLDKTINKYLLDERMEHAKTLLVEGSKNIKEISAAVGFANGGYFSARFKEKFGLLPSEYVKAVQDEKTPAELEKAVA